MDFISKNKVCRIEDDKLGLISKVSMMANRLFPLYLQYVTHSCFSIRLKEKAWLWYFHYDHLNFNGLKIVYQKNLVTCLPQITTPSQVCEECIVNKQQQNQFSRGKSWWPRKLLEFIYFDICIAFYLFWYLWVNNSIFFIEIKDI